MKELDDELRSLLRREDPPPGFAERVMARVQADRRNHHGRPLRIAIGSWVDGLWAALRHPAVGWAAALAMGLVLIIGVVAYQRERRARLEGEQARDQAILALRIASAKLNGVLKQAHRVEHHLKARRGAEQL